MDSDQKESLGSIGISYESHPNYAMERGLDGCILILTVSKNEYGFGKKILKLKNICVIVVYRKEKQKYGKNDWYGRLDRKIWTRLTD